MLKYFPRFFCREKTIFSLFYPIEKSEKILNDFDKEILLTHKSVFFHMREKKQWLTKRF